MTLLPGSPGQFRSKIRGTPLFHTFTQGSQLMSLPRHYKPIEQLLDEFEARQAKPLLAVDTETTGTDWRNGCRLYMLCTFDQDRNFRVWEFDVDPYTRQPSIHPADINEINEHLKDKTLIFQNPKFDIPFMRKEGIEVSWDQIEDTLTASHVLYSNGSHGLKEMGVRYLMIDDSDQHQLEETCKQARSLARKLKWDIYKNHHPTSPGFKAKTRSPLWYADTWLPGMLWRFKQEVLHSSRNRSASYMPQSGPHSDRPRYYTRNNTPFDLNLIPDTWRPASEADSYESLGDAARYGVKDVLRTLRLWNKFYKGLTTETSLPNPSPQRKAGKTRQADRQLLEKYLERREILPALYRMENRGMPCRKDTVKQRIEKFKQTACELTESLRGLTGQPDLNPGSPQQVASILYGPHSQMLQTPTRFTESGQPSTDKDSILSIYEKYAPSQWLRSLSDPHLIVQGHPQEQTSRLFQKVEAFPQYQFTKNLLAIKKLNKAASTLESYLHHIRRGKIHTSILLHGTETTRTSSRDPGLQNVSKDDDRKLPEEIIDWIYNDLGLSIRSAFGPAEDTVWYAIDWSSMQLRLFAYVSGEQSLIDAFAEGWDPHDYMAHRIFRLSQDTKPTKGQRTIAKNTNFGFIFGASPNKIEETSGRPGLYDELNQMFPNAISFMESTKTQVRRHGYVNTPGGYRLYLKHEHAGVNYIIQGAEGEIAQLALRLCDGEIEQENRLRRDQRLKAQASKTAHPLIDPTTNKPCDVLQDYPLSPIMLIHDELLFAAQGTDTDEHKPHVKRMTELMELAGHLYAGYDLPVDVELIRSRWDQKEDFSLHD